MSASWSPDGQWLYFLSDRNLDSVVGAPWGPRQPEPFFDKPMKIYQVALKKGLRSPFKPADELHPETPEKPEAKDETKAATRRRRDEGRARRARDPAGRDRSRGPPAAALRGARRRPGDYARSP